MFAFSPGKPCGVVNAVGKLNDNEHGVVLRECGCGGVFERIFMLPMNID